MDPMALVGMVFTLILLILTGGFILLFPIARRLGRVLENRLEKRHTEPDELARLRETVQTLDADVRALAERQDFIDRLLRAESPPLLRGSDPATPPLRPPDAGAPDAGRDSAEDR